MKQIKCVTGFLPFAILLIFRWAYQLGWYIHIWMLLCSLFFLMNLMCNHFFWWLCRYVMPIIFLESWFSGQFSTIKESCGSPYPTLLLISFKNLLILQLLDNEFHEVVFWIIKIYIGTLQVQNFSRRQKTLDDCNMLKHWLKNNPMHIEDNKYTVDYASAL